MKQSVPSYSVSISASLAALILCAPCPSGAAAVSDFKARTFKTRGGKTLPYRLFIPKAYDKGKAYPLILTLHGAGERGTDNTSELNQNFTRFWADDSIQKDDPCFVVAPQCPPDPQWWVISTPKDGNYKFEETPITDPLQGAVDLVDSLAREFNIDPDRIYVSGLSMGGYGTWYLLAKYTDKWAAAAPACGAGDPHQAEKFNRVPIRTYHDANDDVVNVHYTRDIVNAIKALPGGGAKLTYIEYPTGGHNGAWERAALDPELHRWLFRQVRAAPVSIAPAKARPAPAPLSDADRIPGIALTVDGLGRLHLRGEPAAGISYPALPSGH